MQSLETKSSRARPRRELRDRDSITGKYNLQALINKFVRIIYPTFERFTTQADGTFFIFIIFQALLTFQSYAEHVHHRKLSSEVEWSC